jgi:hypothetical protein
MNLNVTITCNRLTVTPYMAIIANVYSIVVKSE